MKRICSFALCVCLFFLPQKCLLNKKTHKTVKVSIIRSVLDVTRHPPATYDFVVCMPVFPSLGMKYGVFHQKKYLFPLVSLS